MNPALEEWLEDRPQIIKDLARKFPAGKKIYIDGITHYVVSYFEDGSLGVSEIDPRECYHQAIATSHMLSRDICVHHLMTIGVS